MSPLLNWLIRHKVFKTEHYDYAFEHRLQDVEAKIAVLYSWVNGDKFKKFEEMVCRTHEMFAKDLDRQEQIEDMRAATMSQIDLREIREKIDLLMEHYGLELAISEKVK